MARPGPFLTGRYPAGLRLDAGRAGCAHVQTVADLPGADDVIAQNPYRGRRRPQFVRMRAVPAR